MHAARKFVVGLTGGIGSGKSVAAEVFRSLGIHVVNADAIAREVVEPGQPALAEIARHFGSELLTTSGTLDRAAMRTLVFSNPAQKSWLEKLLHPLISDLIQRRLAESGSAYAILESPLLIETEQHTLVDRILVIDASEETQIARAMARDGSEEDIIRSIIGTQTERAARVERADDVVCNEGSLVQLQGKLANLHTKYLEMARTDGLED